MADPKCGGVHLSADPVRPYHRRLVLWNTNRQPAGRQWINEDQIRMLRSECDRALAEIDEAKAHAQAVADQLVADQILNRDPADEDREYIAHRDGLAEGGR